MKKVSSQVSGDVHTSMRWWVAARPWALPASIIPVFYGTALAVAVGGVRFKAGSFLMALAAMILLHTAANMLSDVWDYRRGLDREVTPVSGAIVRGWLTDRQIARASGVLFAIGITIGAILAMKDAPALWAIGALGVFIGVLYSFLKALALGDVAVFLNFGILGATGAWAVQTGRFSMYPMITAIPIALLVVAILHANNWRDQEGDSQHGVTTIASLLGDEGSLHYYGFLLFAPFGFLIAMIWAPRAMALPVTPLPFSAALALFAMPYAIRLWRRAVRRYEPRQPQDFVALDGATAQLNLLFGLLLTVGIAAAALGISMQ